MELFYSTDNEMLELTQKVNTSLLFLMTNYVFSKDVDSLNKAFKLKMELDKAANYYINNQTENYKSCKEFLLNFVKQLDNQK